MKVILSLPLVEPMVLL